MKNTFISILLILSSSVFALSEDIPYPFHQVMKDGTNEMMALNRGEEAFKARIDVVRDAKKHIVVEYYIFQNDVSGKILLNELVAASKRGVQVRVLLDKMMSLAAISSYYAQELLKAGIVVKYYNNASFAQISTVQYRSHRKLLAADDEIAITGGRNIGDEYFNMSRHLNYDDRDALVRGPIVKVMRESFDSFFYDSISKAPKLDKKNDKKQIKKAQDFFVLSEEEEQFKDKIFTVGDKQLAERVYYACPEMTFASDAPGGVFTKTSKEYKTRFRYLRQVLEEKISAIDKALTISSPYFITNKFTRKLLNNLVKKNVDITVHTNSLGSTDAIYMSANLYLHLKGWLKKGIQFYLHDGAWTDDESPENRVNNSKLWGTHAKTQVYETSQYSEIMIGTYNLDNRSDYYNTEMAVFCKGNDEFTQIIKDDLSMKMRNGIKVLDTGKAIGRDGIKKNVTGAKPDATLKMHIITLPSWLIDFLL